MPELVPLSGSERSELPSATPAATPLDPSQVITVTVLLRRRAEIPAELINTTATVSTEELGRAVRGRPGRRHPRRRRARPLRADRDRVPARVPPPEGERDGRGDDGRVRHHADRGHLRAPGRQRVGDPPVPDRRRCRCRPSCRGSSSACSASTPGRRRARTFGAPAPAGAVTAHAASAVPGAVPLTALQVASFYDFPAGTDGTGQTIAIIELGGGYNAADLTTYFSGLSLSVPTVTAVGVDDGSNSPGQAADGEVELDIEVAGAVAPKASFVVYFAPNTDQGFIDAISDAINAKPTPIAVSISWGGPENSWASQSMSGDERGDLGRGRARRHGHGGGGRQRVERQRQLDQRGAGRLPRVEPVLARLRRHHPGGQHRHQHDHVRGGLERDRDPGRRGRRRRVGHVRAADLAEDRRGARVGGRRHRDRQRRRARPRRPRRGRQRRPVLRLPGRRRRQAAADRRHLGRRPALGRA